MKTISKLLILSFVLSCIFQFSALALGEQQDDSIVTYVPSEVTNPLDNVTIEMITSLTSYREDNIPSILPGESFTVQFNITNESDQQLQQLEFYPEVNGYGEFLDNSTITKSSMSSGESWLTGEYSVNVISESSVVGSPLDLVIALDISGSMQDEIDVLKADLINVIEEVSSIVPDVRIGLVFFGGPYTFDNQNPYNNPALVHQLTDDTQHITDVLAATSANNGYEPWGDALWVAKNQLDWRSEAVKLVTLITDEPCDAGMIVGDGPPEQFSGIDYNGPILYELFSNFAFDRFILCTIAASGADSLTIEQLQAGAATTGGTYIQIGGGGPQTSDMPSIIGEFIETYAVELDLKLTAVFSCLNASDEREFKEEIFTVLLDDMPPEIDQWVYFSEDFVTDEKFVNIICDVKDVTGVPYVEIYFRFDGLGWWITTNSTPISDDRYLLSLPITDTNTLLQYQIFTKDYLNNEILTEVFEVDLTETEQYSLLPSGKREVIELIPNQSIVVYLKGNANSDSIGIVFTPNLYNEFSVIAANVNDSQLVLSASDTHSEFVTVPTGHDLKMQFMSDEQTSIVIANVVPEEIYFGDNFKRDIGFDDAILLKIDNRIDKNDIRSILADSKVVETKINIFNSTDYNLISSGHSEVVLPEELCYVLIYPNYHEGEILVSYNFESVNEPYDHYYAPHETSSWSYLTILVAFIALLFVVKTKRRWRNE